MFKSKWNRHTFTDEFISQIVQFYLSGIKKSDIMKEYDLYTSTLDCFISNIKKRVCLKPKIISLKPKKNHWTNKIN